MGFPKLLVTVAELCPISLCGHYHSKSAVEFRDQFSVAPPHCGIRLPVNKLTGWSLSLGSISSSYLSSSQPLSLTFYSKHLNHMSHRSLPVKGSNLMFVWGLVSEVMVLLLDVVLWLVFSGRVGGTWFPNISAVSLHCCGATFGLLVFKAAVTASVTILSVKSAMSFKVSRKNVAICFCSGAAEVDPLSGVAELVDFSGCSSGVVELVDFSDCSVAELEDFSGSSSAMLSPPPISAVSPASWPS